MATAQYRIFKTTSPAGWAWTFDRTDISDGAIDNFATAANAGAALDAIKALVGGVPGTLYAIQGNISTFEPPA